VRCGFRACEARSRKLTDESCFWLGKGKPTGSDGAEGGGGERGRGAEFTEYVSVKIEEIGCIFRVLFWRSNANQHDFESERLHLIKVDLFLT
jgi:hypothetical protein